MANNFTIEEVRDFWDSVVSTYEPANEELGYIHTHRFEKALEYGDIKSGLRILNIWSRTGNLIPYLRRTPGVNVSNREVSPAMLTVARKKYPQEDFGITDLEDLREFADGTFDRVISLETLEHTPNPELFLKELRRVLRPGGRLVMSLPPRGMELGLQLYELFFSNHGEGPHRFLWSWEVKRLLHKADLQLLSHKPTLVLPLGSDALTRRSEKILTGLFGKTPLSEFGLRHFYLCTRS